MNYVKGVLMKRMKDIIPITQHHYWKPKYLNRLVTVEMRRRERYKELRSLGYSFNKAHQISRRGIK
jgi:hypothetical protein